MAPWVASLWVAALPSTALSTGPMHGVHPNPKAMPAIGAANGPKRDRLGCQRFSW